MARRPIVAGNWKMHKTVGEAVDLVSDLRELVSPRGRAEVVLAPPFTALAAVQRALAESDIALAGQNCHWEPAGAFTGEVSAPMLREVGVDGVVLGHSERRAYFAETDEALARKVPVALEAGLRPILCVGETESQRNAEATEDVLRHQVEADLAGVAEERLGEVVIAYEPVWAIGTGRTATPEQATEAIGFIRSLISSRSDEAAGSIRVLYGGSVTPDNAVELLGRAEIDGALVGGASLDPMAFAQIVSAAER